MSESELTLSTYAQHLIYSLWNVTGKVSVNFSHSENTISVYIIKNGNPQRVSLSRAALRFTAGERRINGSLVRLDDSTSQPAVMCSLNPFAPPSQNQNANYRTQLQHQLMQHYQNQATLSQLWDEMRLLGKTILNIKPTVPRISYQSMLGHHTLTYLDYQDNHLRILKLGHLDTELHEISHLVSGANRTKLIKRFDGLRKDSGFLIARAGQK